MTMIRHFLAAAALLMGLWLTSADAAERRVALVVGNSTYQNATTLPNPVSDARAIADILGKLEFEVTLKLDLDERALQLALRDFGIAAETADVALVYYSGHGLQIDGQNYIVPIDARLQRERDLFYEAVPLSAVLGEVSQARRLGVVILDACRDNPLADQLASSLGVQSRRVGRGLARLDDTPSDTLVAYATRADAVAFDGTGAHSPYAGALIELLGEQDLELGLLFRKVRDKVLKETNGRQEPIVLGSIGAEPFYFNPRPPNRPPFVTAAAPLEVSDNADGAKLAIAAPSDPDGDTLTVEITGLPRHGKVLSGGNEVAVGEKLAPAELAALTYDPQRGFAGDAGALTYSVTDPRGAAAEGTVEIASKVSNRAPTLVAPTRVTVVPNLLGLGVATDPDGDKPTVTVTALPVQGSVRLGDSALKVGQAIPADRLPQLRFDPEGGALGELGTLDLAIDDGNGGRISVRVAVVASAAPAAPVMPAVAAAPAAKEVAVREPPAPATVPTASPAAASLPFVSISAATVREKPANNAARLATLNIGDAVKVVGERTASGWYQVETTAGTKGFVAARLLRPAGAAEPSVAYQIPDLPVAAPPPGPVVATRETAAPVTRNLGALRDCENCPEIVNVPPGRFVMGSVDGDGSERPPVPITISAPFAIGKYEVTIGEWNACVADRACDFQPEPADGSDRVPVRNISWDDAEQYVNWLAQKTGKRYRLPSEAEWEYAARAGTKNRFWWGNEVGNREADCTDCGPGFDRKRPVEVGTLPLNPFGLGETSGNVAEWVADCWFPSHKGHPQTSAVRDGPSCQQRVLRGGSWRNDQAYITSASRLSYDTGVRYYTNGLRVARDAE